jgi:hypothetical protein
LALRLSLSFFPDIILKINAHPSKHADNLFRYS